MGTNLFTIGDVVALTTHPYLEVDTEIIVSGDHLSLSPLMVVTEVYKSRYSFAEKKENGFKYKCVWFSTKQYKFIYSEIEEACLKLIMTCTSNVNIVLMCKGHKMAFKTMQVELGKKKSSLSHEDNSSNAGTGNTTINPLLAFLPPLLQLVDYGPHKTKHQIEDKNQNTIRHVPSFDVKVNFFDPASDKISTCTLPLEALDFVSPIDDKTITHLKQVIESSGFLCIEDNKKETLRKPRNIAYRSGSYFLRGYDYLTNKVEETEIKATYKFNVIKTPFIAEVPKFDIIRTPQAATSKFIEMEITGAIKNAGAVSGYIRIKYKNRNEQLSYRTLKNYNIVLVEESGINVSYVVGYCLLRCGIRSFRIDRIQSLQQLLLSFNKP